MKGLRLPLVRRPDPVLSEDELEAVRVVLRVRRDELVEQMEGNLVSESVIRERMYLDSALGKIGQVLRSMR